MAIKFKDPTFLINWVKAMLYRMSFWKYRVLFRYIKYILRNIFWAFFKDLNFKGIKISLRGKISVAGNARARSLAYSIGNTSHATFDNRVLSQFLTMDSFTGVMGFKISFYF
jgi:ribosomal protein S3